MFEILVNKKNNQKEIALLENGKLVEYYIDEEEIRKEGNIYVGIVKDIVKGMQSAFVDIGAEKNSFIHLKDILDKVDESKEEIKNDVDISDVIKVGEKLLVQVKKYSNLQKGARVSTHINLPSKYIALMPNTEIVTVSQKITDKQEQQRLIKLVKENLSEGNGAIIRTSAEGKEKEIIDDIKNIESEKLNNKDEKPQSGFGCRAGNSTFWINWQGEMTSCGMLSAKGIDIKEYGMNQSWKMLNEQVSSTKRNSKCPSCKYKNICQVCVASCQAETGEFDGVPQYLCDMCTEYEKLLVEYINKKV